MTTAELISRECPKGEPESLSREQLVQPAPRPADKFKAGLYDVEPDWAKGQPFLHQSLAGRLIGLSPLHAWYKAFGQQPGEEEFNDAKSFGTLAHALLLGGGRLVAVEADDWRTKDAREKRDAALAEGKTPVLARRLDEAGKLVERVKAELARMGYPAISGRSEVIAIWKESGIWCQGMVDHLIIPPTKRKTDHAIIYDFKFSTEPVTKKKCEQKFIEYGYDIQETVYRSAVETILPRFRGRVDSFYVFAEVNAPNAVRIGGVSGSMRTSGMLRWTEAKSEWRKHLAKFGTEIPWPDYLDNGEPFDCPSWALREQREELDNFNPEAA